MRTFFVLVLLFVPLSAFAQSIVINEIAWMGSFSIDGVDPKQWWRYEWLELFNAKDVPLQLEGWSIELYRGDELYFQIPVAGTVPAHGYFLVGASDKIPGVDINYSNLGGKFLNTGQRVVLSNASGVVVDEVDATTSWLGGDNKTKQTMERIPKSVGGSDPPTLWQTSVKSGGTPKTPNSEGIIQPSEGVAKESQTKPSLVKNEVKLNRVKDKTEKDSFESSSLSSSVNSITLLAGFLALGFSGVLLLVKRSLALRQRRRT